MINPSRYSRAAYHHIRPINLPRNRTLVPPLPSNAASMLFIVDDGNGRDPEDAVGAGTAPTVALSRTSGQHRDLPLDSSSPWDEPGFRYRDPVAAVVGRVTGWQAFVFALVVYGIGEKILLPHYQGYFHVSGDISTWRPDVRALFEGFVSLPTIYAAYVWQTGAVRNLLAGFARAGSFANRAAFDGFIEDVRSWSARDRWWLISAALAVSALLWQDLVWWNPDHPIPAAPWFEAGEPLSRNVGLVLSLPFWYLVIQITIREVRLAWTLKQLWRRLGASFVLTGRGQASALSALSRHISIMITFSAVVFVNLVLGLLEPQIRGIAIRSDVRLWVIGIWAAYLVVIPGVILALVWPAHKVMSRRKAERIKRINREIDSGFASIESGLNDGSGITATIERLDGLRRLREWLEADLPRWPVGHILRTASWSTVVPLALSALAFVLDRAA